MSAETMCRPSRPLRIVRSSRVDQPPVSGVPVAGAKAGSIESIWGCILARSWCEGEGEAYVNGEVDGLVADGLADFLDDTVRTCEREV